MRTIAIPLLVFSFATASVGGDTVPKDVQAALEKNSSVFTNVFIEGVRRQRFIRPADEVLQRIQTLEPAGEFTQELGFKLQFQGMKFRESIEYPEEPSSSIQNKCYEISYDSETFRFGYLDTKNPSDSSLHIYTPTRAAEHAEEREIPGLFDQMKFWYLSQTGFVGPTLLKHLGNPVRSIVSNAPPHNILSLRENENTIDIVIDYIDPWQSLETFDIESNPELLSLRGSSKDFQMRVERERRQLVGKHRLVRMILNKSFGYAVEEKWETRKETGALMFHTKNSDFVQLGSNDVWFPKRCVVEAYAYWTAPLYVSPETLYVTEILIKKCEQPNVQGDVFSIWYDIPGTYVSDWRVKIGPTAEPDIYHVPASIDDLPKKGQRYKTLLVVFSVIGIAGVLLWFRKMNRKGA